MMLRALLWKNLILCIIYEAFGKPVLPGWVKPSSWEIETKNH